MYIYILLYASGHIMAILMAKGRLGSVVDEVWWCYSFLSAGGMVWFLGGWCMTKPLNCATMNCADNNPL